MTERFNFVYDPTRQGFDTALWKQVAGTTVAVDMTTIVFPDAGADAGVQASVEELTVSEGVTVSIT